MNTGEILDGRYEIVARLGAGGMGEVYKATHLLLGSSRVVKVVHPQIAGNTDARDRFLREARVATKVQHPNVATLFDFAALPDGSHYMVWEFIDGENLAQRLRSGGTLPPRLAVRIAVQALHGLEAIHRAGIVHRDISPENLMITRDDTVKVIDLGVAKIDDPEVTSQTRTGIFVGKLRYAAPEQLGFLNEGEKIDGRADLYALAMVIVELLTGRPPYEAKSPHEYFLHHAREIPTTTVELPASLPGSGVLQGMLQKALSRSREDRFASAHDFAAALEAVEVTLPEVTATVALAFDGDATWRPSDGDRETMRTPAPPSTEPGGTAPGKTAPASSPAAIPATAAIPAPPIAVAPPPPPPPPAPTVRTPLPDVGSYAPKPRRQSAVLIIALVAVLAVAGGAFALWPRISPLIMPAAPKPAPPKVAQTPSKPASSTMTVTPTTTTETVAPAPPPTIVPAPIPNVVKPETVPSRHDERSPDRTPPNTTTTPSQESDEEPVRPARGVAVYVDGPGRHGGNDRALARLRAELRGVNEVVLLGGGMQVTVYRALHRYIPSLTFGSESNVVIKFDATPERLGFERQHLAASATIEKDGRLIFRYDLTSASDPAAAADAFAQTVAEAFE
jgi:serine/threonine-protein kinase